jgi:hypothetical protein
MRLVNYHIGECCGLYSVEGEGEELGFNIEEISELLRARIEDYLSRKTEYDTPPKAKYDDLPRTLAFYSSTAESLGNKKIYPLLGSGFICNVLPIDQGFINYVASLARYKSEGATSFEGYSFIFRKSAVDNHLKNIEVIYDLVFYKSKNIILKKEKTSYSILSLTQLRCFTKEQRLELMKSARFFWRNVNTSNTLVLFENLPTSMEFIP